MKRDYPGKTDEIVSNRMHYVNKRNARTPLHKIAGHVKRTPDQVFITGC
jgi:hypothetical protein